VKIGDLQRDWHGGVEREMQEPAGLIDLQSAGARRIETAYFADWCEFPPAAQIGRRF
jgi:hypothetical protein